MLKRPYLLIISAILLIGLFIIFIKKDLGKGPVGFLFRPFWNMEATIAEEVKAFFSRYLHLVKVKEENAKLKERLLLLEQELAYYKEREALYQSLEKLYKVSSAIKYPQVVSRVIYKGIDPYGDIFIIDKGAKDGLMPQMPVLALAEGVGVALVGQVVEVYRNFSKVILLTDPSFAADVKLLRTQDRAILRGKAEPQAALEFLPLYSQAKAGDLVVTSGQDLLFPPGLVVGELRALKKDPQGLFQRGEVRPLIDFYNLSYVVVLLKIPEVSM